VHTKSSVTISYTADDLNVIQEPFKLFLHSDRLGSTQFATHGETGAVLSWVGYDEWGQHTAGMDIGIATLSADGGSYRELFLQSFTGHMYDDVLDVYFAQARMYDAGNMRFLAADPIKGFVDMPMTLVPYVYCFNNPLKYIDPDGEFPIPVLIPALRIVGGGLISGGFELLSQVADPDVDKIIWDSVWISAGAGAASSAIGIPGGINPTKIIQVIRTGGSIVISGVESIATDLVRGRDVNLGNAARNAGINLLADGMRSIIGTGANRITQRVSPARVPNQFTWRDLGRESVDNIVTNYFSRILGSLLPWGDF